MNAATLSAVRFLSVLLALAAGRGAWAQDGCRAADLDGDGVVDAADFDILIPLLGSPSPRADLDGDGLVGNADAAIVVGLSGTTCSTCVADLNDSGVVCGDDYQLLQQAYGVDCRPDLNRDGAVDELDTAILMAYAGSPPAAERADLNGDAVVDGADLDLLEAAFGTDCRADLNRDGAIDARDHWPLHAAWGECPSDAVHIDPKPTCDEGGG